LDCFEITIGAGRETSLDHIDLEPLQLPGNTQLLIAGHGSPRGLLAVTQGGIKDDQFVSHGGSPGISMVLVPAGTAKTQKARCEC